MKISPESIPKVLAPLSLLYITECEQRTAKCTIWILKKKKGRGTRGQIAKLHWIIEKTREFQKKKSTSASLTILMPLTV